MTSRSTAGVLRAELVAGPKTGGGAGRLAVWQQSLGFLLPVLCLGL